MPEETRDLTAQHVWDTEALSLARREGPRLSVPTLTVLYHPDCERIGDQARLFELIEGRTALLSRTDPEFLGPGGARRPLGDLHLSRSPLRLMAANAGGVRLVVGESRTRVNADGDPVEEARDFAEDEIRHGVVLELADRVVVLLHLAAEMALQELPGQSSKIPDLIGENEGIRRLRQEIRRVADLDIPILIRGETGTGKELVARAIHQTGQRRNAVCLSVNMGAIPPSLAPAELFGSVRGAFTGSLRDQLGYFQRAHGGTLFLDEIGETPGEVQVMLLRVLETGEVQRVGSPTGQKVDVRLIAATDTNLETAIAEGRFRSPLLHRLSGYEILVPPLRERRDDFGRLLLHFLRQELKTIGEPHRLDPPSGTDAPWLPSSLVARLARFDWPGNVRQLRNIVRQIVIDSRSSDSIQIGPQIERLLREGGRPRTGPGPDAAAAGSAGSSAPVPRRRAPAASYRSPTEVPVAEILAALRANGWEIKSTAAQLGISRPSLYVLIDRLPGIRKAADLGKDEIQAAWTQCGGNLDAMVERLEVSKKGLLQRMRQLGIS